MSTRIQILTFEEDNLKRLVEKKYSVFRNSSMISLKEFPNDVDDTSKELILNTKSIDDLFSLKDYEISIILSFFFDYLETENCNIKYSYQPSLISLKMYKNDFETIMKSCSQTLKIYINYILRGRSLKNPLEQFKPVMSEQDFKIGYLYKEEREFMIREISNNFMYEIDGTAVETLLLEFAEIGGKYEEAIIQIC
jgi:hypothetical protein